MDKSIQFENIDEKKQWNFSRTLVAIIVLLTVGVAIISIIKFGQYVEKTQYRVSYTSEEMMLEELCGTWRLCFLNPEYNGTSILVFNDNYTYSYAALTEDDEVEIISTYKFSLDYENSLIHVDYENKKYDILCLDEQIYVRTNINGKSPENWMLYKKR